MLLPDAPRRRPTEARIAAKRPSSPGLGFDARRSVVSPEGNPRQAAILEELAKYDAKEGFRRPRAGGRTHRQKDEQTDPQADDVMRLVLGSRRPNPDNTDPSAGAVSSRDEARQILEHELTARGWDPNKWNYDWSDRLIDQWFPPSLSSEPNRQRSGLREMISPSRPRLGLDDLNIRRRPKFLGPPSTPFTRLPPGPGLYGIYNEGTG